MPERYGKAARQLLEMDKFANLYGKQFAPDATGAIVHAYHGRVC
jgi:hypothetical protein